MSSLNVSIVQKNKSKNSFGNSFVFSDDLNSQNQFVSFGNKQEKAVKQVTNKNDTLKQDKKVNILKVDKKQLKQQLTVSKPTQKQVNKKNNNKKQYVQKPKDQHMTQKTNEQQHVSKPKKKKNRQKKRNETIDIESKIPDKNKTIHEQDEMISQPVRQNVKKRKNVISQEKPQANKIKFKQLNNRQNQINQQKDQQSQKKPLGQLVQKFQTKVSQIHTNINKLSSNIKDIKKNYAEIDKFAQDEILFKKNDRKKQRQIRDFLMQKRLQKQSRQKKLKQIRQRQKEIVSKTIQQTQQAKRKQKQEKIKKIKQIDYVKAKQRHQKYIEFQQSGRELAQSLIQRYKNNEPFHVRKQREFQTIQQRKKLQQQEILQQRKQRYQSLDLDELEQHKRQYEQRKQQWENNRRQQREQQLRKIQEDNSLLRDNIWKGPSHDLVDQQLAEKKRKEKQPKQKIKRMKNYQEFIKNNFLPKTHQPKRSNSIVVHDQRIAESMGNYAGRYHVPSDGELAHYDPRKKHVKKYRYFQGKAVGEVVQSVPVSRSYSQQKKIGESYLEYLKQLPKKQHNSQETTQIDSGDLQMISKKFNAVTKVKRQPMPFYEHSPKKRTVSISEKPSKQEVKLVYQQLKNHDIKLKSKRQLIRAMKQNSPGSMDMEKSVNSDLILNMERKLDLLAKL